MSPAVSVVIMAFNEVSNLEAVVRELAAALQRLPGGAQRSDEILIVDDGSTDGTAALADRLASEMSGVRVIHHEANLGLGGVYRTGFEQATRALLSFFPADGQFPGDILVRFHPLLEDYDLVLGYLPRRPDSLLARGLSAGEKALYRFLFGAMPLYQGVFMVRRSILPSLKLETAGRGWGIVMEMVLKIHRGPYRVVSIPTALRPRMSGQSKVNNARTIWINLQQALALRRVLARR